MGHDPTPADSASQGAQQSPRANVASSRQADVAERCRSGPRRCQPVSKTLWSDLRKQGSCPPPERAMKRKGQSVQDRSDLCMFDTAGT